LKNRLSQQTDTYSAGNRASAASVLPADQAMNLWENDKQPGTAESMDQANKLTLLDVGFLSISMAEALSLIRGVIREDGKESVSFINADCLNISTKDEEYRSILNSQSIVLPDGAGINIGCRLIGERLEANLNGTDLLPVLCEVAVEDEITLYLLGAAPGVAARMRENLMMTYPGLDVVGEHHGYFDHDEDSDEVIAKINASKPNIVLVAFGAPRQEKWIHNHRDKIDSNILVGVGGLFDFYSGDKKRAPLWMRKCGLEWTYRLYLEPGRLWRRYIIGNPLFVYRIMRWKKKYQRQNAGNDSA
jgi:N-acetylglucosaminyldiphosphoundecaprenol N-acetyl-beta-D-mannosaminyltransferase